MTSSDERDVTGGDAAVSTGRGAPTCGATDFARPPNVCERAPGHPGLHGCLTGAPAMWSAVSSVGCTSECADGHTLLDGCVAGDDTTELRADDEPEATVEGADCTSVEPGRGQHPCIRPLGHAGEHRWRSCTWDVGACGHKPDPTGEPRTCTLPAGHAGHHLDHVAVGQPSWPDEPPDASALTLAAEAESGHDIDLSDGMIARLRDALDVQAGTTVWHRRVEAMVPVLTDLLGQLDRHHLVLATTRSGAGRLCWQHGFVAAETNDRCASNVGGLGDEGLQCRRPVGHPGEHQAPPDESPGEVLAAGVRARFPGDGGDGSAWPAASASYRTDLPVRPPFAADDELVCGDKRPIGFADESCAAAVGHELPHRSLNGALWAPAEAYDAGRDDPRPPADTGDQVWGIPEHLFSGLHSALLGHGLDNDWVGEFLAAVAPLFARTIADASGCIAEGHWTTVYDAESGWAETVHDPDEGPCEFRPPADTTARPPTAGEALAHMDAGGRVAWWDLDEQEWATAGPYEWGSLAEADPSAPQPGLRLVPAGPNAYTPGARWVWDGYNGEGYWEVPERPTASEVLAHAFRGGQIEQMTPMLGQWRLDLLTALEALPGSTPCPDIRLVPSEGVPDATSGQPEDGGA